MDKRVIKIYGASLLFSMLVGFSFISLKSVTDSATTLEILTYRYNFAFLGTLFLAAKMKNRIRFRGREKKSIFYTALFYIGFMVLQAVGLIYTTSIVSGIIFALIPIIAKVIAGFFLGEQSTGVQNAFVLLSVGALILMIVLDSGEIDANLYGILLLLLSSTSMAVSNVYMRYVRKIYSPLEISFAISLLGFSTFNLATVGKGIIQGNLSDYFLPAESSTFIFATAYLGIFCTLLTAFLISYMLANLEAVKATIFGNLSTAISLVAGAIVLSEPLEWYHVFCTGLIIAGVVGVSLSGMKKGAKGGIS